MITVSLTPEQYHYRCFDTMLISSCHILRKLFKSRWKRITGREWDNSKNDGEEFKKYVGKEIFNKACKFKSQKSNVEAGHTEKWDMTLLSAVLQNFGDPKDPILYKEENEYVTILKNLRNDQKHHSDNELTTEEYEDAVTAFIKALEALKVRKKDIDKIIKDAEATSNDFTNLCTKKEDITESTTWDHLSNGLKTVLGNKNVIYQGNQIKLCYFIEEHDDLVNFLDGKILVQLANGENTPCILNDNVPERLDYYVDRTVTSRNILKMDVLKEECEDVFVMEGMEKHQLSSLVPKDESTNVSGNQLVRVTSRFILLEYEPDFYKICNIATTPVHWVQYKNGALEFVMSSGSVKALQKHIHDPQKSFNEEELASSIQKVVAIADSPGMGKTCLLANIAHQIMREQPTMPVRFIVLKEFVDALYNKEINMESIVKQIAEQSSEYEFGKKLVENDLKTQKCVLLFDGLDEVLSNQMPTAKKILQAAAELRSAKVFVATRPHLRNEIENTLHIFAYTMQPFNESNQINFLMEFWKEKGATPNESLRKFAEECVKQLSSKMRDNERSIAAIPLQCRMLAETYEENAIRCSNVGYQSYESADSDVMVDSIFGIYERHMELRFEKIRTQQESLFRRFVSFLTRSDQYEIIKNVHMYFALELLFPEHTEKFKASLNSSIELHELCGLGILEATHSNDIRFVHRTFAEYLVGWLAHENVINNSPNRDLLLSTVLKLKKVEETEFYDVFSTDEIIMLESFEFDFSVICYFVNGFAKKYAPNAPAIHNEEVLMPFYIASARHNYESIPHIVTHSVAEINPNQSSELNMRDLFYIAARYSDLELMKIFCTKIDITKINFIQIKYSYQYYVFILTPLHVAIQRGHYRLVEYLLGRFEHIASQLRYLIHLCVWNSVKDSNSIVEDKIQIVKLLSKVNKKWIYEEVYNRIPLTQDFVHLRLFECLLQEHGDLNKIDKDGNTLLHKITKDVHKPFTFTGESYHEKVNALSRQEFKLFNKPNKNQITPLHFAVQHIEELLSTTLEIFVSNGADLNAVDKQGDSVLFYAIRYDRSVELMRMMINLGADTNHRNYTGENSLHFSLQKENLSALQYFLQTHHINVNDQDVNGNTPLHLAAVKWEKDSWRKHSESIMMSLMKMGSNVNAENNLHYTPFIHAFECGKGLSVTIIKEMEKHGLNITKAVASNVTALFLNLKIICLSDVYIYLSSVPSNILEYLIEKGGQFNFEFTDNFWKWEVVQEAMPDIIEHTHITSELLANSKQHGILTEYDCVELETLHSSLKSKRFFEMVQNKSGSFERVYVIMRGNEDLSFAVKKLDACWYAAQDKLRKQIFVKGNTRVKELIESNVNVIAVVTNDLEFSVKRIQDTVDENVQIVLKHELEQTPPGRQNHLFVLKCDTLTTELVDKLVSLNRTCLCVCKQTHDGVELVEGCEIVTEAHDWTDISSKFRNKLWVRVEGNLHNLNQLFSTPKILRQIWERDIELDKRKNATNLKLVKNKIVHEQSTYLSIEVFSHFLPDKLVFVNINEQDLKTYAKYGHKIGDPSQDIQSVDYMILSKTEIHLFDNICKQANSNVHLIEHDDGRFKLVRTWGSQESLAKFLETTSCDFPFCHCTTSNKLVITFRVYFGIYGEHKLVKCELDDLLPKGRRVFGVEEQIDLFKLRELVQHFDDPKQFTSYFNHQLAILKDELEPKRYGKHIPEIICKLVEHVGNPEQHENLYQLAVNTLFPHLAKIVQSTSVVVDKYMQLGLLEYREKYLVFRHEVLATYFIAEMIIDQVDSGNECFDEIFRNCFDNAYMNPISFCLGDDSEYRPKPMATYKFKETRLFKYLDYFATNDNHKDAISSELTNVISQQSHAKWIHSIVNDNLVNLFEVFMKLGFDDLNTFESEDLVVLAVAHGDLSLVELVTHQYRTHTNKELNNIKLPFLNNDDWLDSEKCRLEGFISVVDVAALKSHYSVFEYLSRILDQPQMEHLVYFCVANTHAHHQVEDRKRIITFLIEKKPSQFQEANQPKYFPILAPKIHVDLIIHLINLGVDVHVTDEWKENMLHLCAEYLTPEEYHRVVNALVERQETELFHSREQITPHALNVALQHLELLDSTIELFSSAKVDFNAVDIEDNTPLRRAVTSQRSARVLDSLINNGADENYRHFNRSVLHDAAKSGNLTALKFFILRGHDVNVTDENGDTPLHGALKSDLIYSFGRAISRMHEMVVLLVELGADINAINNQQKTPLDIASENERFTVVDQLGFIPVETRTKEFLIEHCAKSYEAFMEQTYSKWQSEVINNNLEKLTTLTKWDSALVQKLKSAGTSPNVEELMGKGDANKFYSMLLEKDYDLKMILKLLHDTCNTEAVNLLTKEVISTLYDALMSRKYSFVHFAMQIKEVYEVLLPFLNEMELIDRNQYTEKLNIIQLICMLDAEFLKSKRTEMLSPLHLALQSKHEKQFELIQLLISHKVDVNERESRGLTPLNCAVQQKPVPPRVIDIVKLLIENGADPDAVDKQGPTFLHRAPYFLTPELYDELILFFDFSGRKDSLKLLSDYNRSHLHHAVLNFDPLLNTLDIFKSNGIDFNGQSQSPYGNSVVFHAIQGSRKAKFLRTLFTYGADWKIQNKNQENALHIAALFGNVSAMKLFISLGCDVNAKNTEDRTPLHNAFLAKDSYYEEIMTEHEIVVMLLKERVDVTAKDAHGKTPIDLAKARLGTGKAKQKTIEVLEKYSSK